MMVWGCGRVGPCRQMLSAQVVGAGELCSSAHSQEHRPGGGVLSIQAGPESPALPCQASPVYVVGHLPGVLHFILHAQSFRLLLVTWTNTHNVLNAWSGTDLSVCSPLALDFHPKAGDCGSLGKDQSAWTGQGAWTCCHCEHVRHKGGCSQHRAVMR